MAESNGQPGPRTPQLVTVALLKAANWKPVKLTVARVNPVPTTAVFEENRRERHLLI